LEARHLRAILFADIVGYTALMQVDEQKAAVLRRKFHQFIEEKVSAHDGDVNQFYGDGALCLFQNSLQAVRCAIELQRSFRQDPSVPVRVGLHLGSVVFEDGKVFGDSINIASRIESMGVPGGVLISKKVRDDVKNQPDLQFAELGRFDFKNVQEPIEVYALAMEGLPVPDRSELSGKFKEKPVSGRSRWILPAVIAAIAILAIGYWQIGNASSSLLSEEVRQQRLAVMVFENQTMDSEMESFGRMISDWLTKGLMETGEANIISAANIQHAIDASRIGKGPDPDFVSNTGVNIMLQGRYYRQEDQLIIHANIVDVQSGQVIHPVEKRGSRDQMLQLLDDFTEEILGYWAVRDQKRFAQDPPNYRAYREYIKALPLQISDPAQTEQHCLNAYELDSTFYAPLFTILSLQYQRGHGEQMRDLLDFLEERQENFGKWESLRYREWAAIYELDWLRVAQLVEQRYEMDSSDYTAARNASVIYSGQNRPVAALAVLSSFDMRLSGLQDAEISWHPALLAFPHYLLSNYAAIDSLATNYDLPKFPDALAVMHMQALVKLDSLKRLDHYYQIYREKEVLSNVGQPTPFDQITGMVCDALLLAGKKEYLIKYSNMLRNEVIDQPEHPNYYRIIGHADFYEGDYTKALAAWQNEVVRPEDWPGWMHHSLGSDLASRIGVCYAYLGEYDQANKQLQQIASVPDVHASIRGIRNYYSARILAALGKDEEAIAFLEKAFAEGFEFFGPIRYIYDPFLFPLFDHPGFQEFVRPKG